MGGFFIGVKMTVSISNQLKLDLSQLQQDALLDLFGVDIRQYQGQQWQYW